MSDVFVSEGVSGSTGVFVSDGATGSFVRFCVSYSMRHD